MTRSDPVSAQNRVARWAQTVGIHEHEVDFVPVLPPDGFRVLNTRIHVDLRERPALTRDAFQDLATRVAKAFQSVVGQDRKVKVVVRPRCAEEAR